MLKTTKTIVASAALIVAASAPAFADYDHTSRHAGWHRHHAAHAGTSVHHRHAGRAGVAGNVARGPVVAPVVVPPAGVVDEGVGAGLGLADLGLGIGADAVGAGLDLADLGIGIGTGAADVGLGAVDPYGGYPADRGVPLGDDLF